MNKQEAIQATEEISKAFDEITERMCALQLQYPELGIFAAYRFSQHPIIGTEGFDPDNVAATGSTVMGNIETTLAGMLHILHGIAIRENQPEVAEALIVSLSTSWEKMKKDYNITIE